MRSPMRRSARATRTLSRGSSRRTRLWVAPLPDIGLYLAVPRLVILVPFWFDGSNSFLDALKLAPTVAERHGSASSAADAVCKSSDSLNRDTDFVAVFQP